MKTAALLAAASLLLATGALAQSSPPANGPPPPGLNDPGVKASTSDAASHAAAPQDAPLPAHAPDAARHAKHMSLPQVSQHQEGQNEVQEYRRSGLLYMVVVTPPNGIPQTYMVDPDGTRHMQPGQPPVTPVMYKVLEWGKSKPASAGSTANPPGDDGH